MAINEFPIGEPLKSVSIVEYKEDGGDNLCLDKVQLFFEKTSVTLLPLADSDEIEIIQEHLAYFEPAVTPSWCRNFLGKKLMTVWVCKNDQGYQDQVIFAFEYLRPSLSFIAECSSILVFQCQPLKQEVLQVG